MCALTIAAWRVDSSWMRSKACAAYQHSASDGSRSAARLASWCFTAWKAPMIWPNCSRVQRILARHLQAAARAAVGVGGEQDQPGVDGRVDGGRAAGELRRRRVAKRHGREPAGHVGPGQAVMLDAGGAAFDQPQTRAGVVAGRDDDRVGDRRVGHERLAAGQTRRRARASASSSASHCVALLAEATVTIACRRRRCAGSQRCCASSSPPSTSADGGHRRAEERARRARSAELLRDQREIEQLEPGAAVRRRHDHAGDAELGEPLPQPLFVSRVALHDLRAPASSDTLG